MKFYTIFDREGKVSRDPFSAPSDQDACRMVTGSMLTPKGEVIKNSPLFMYAAQFDLMHVGTWNAEKGVIEPPNADSLRDDTCCYPSPVANLIALIPKES